MTDLAPPRRRSQAPHLGPLHTCEPAVFSVFVTPDPSDKHGNLSIAREVAAPPTGSPPPAEPAVPGRKTGPLCGSRNSGPWPHAAGMGCTPPFHLLPHQGVTEEAHSVDGARGAPSLQTPASEASPSAHSPPPHWVRPPCSRLIRRGEGIPFFFQFLVGRLPPPAAVSLGQILAAFPPQGSSGTERGRPGRGGGMCRAPGSKARDPARMWSPLPVTLGCCPCLPGVPKPQGS